jgi:hypothetical protein
MFLPPLGCRNDRLKTALGWVPVYPTYRSGLSLAIGKRSADTPRELAAASQLLVEITGPVGRDSVPTSAVFMTEALA